MISKDFIENYSLFRKLKYSKVLPNYLAEWVAVPINMGCNQCNSVQTFNLINDFGYIWSPNNKRIENQAKNRVLPLQYQCQSCKQFERHFYVYVNSELDEIYKVGQYPEWELSLIHI